MEAECRKLTPEVRDLAPRDAVQTVRAERLLDLGELRVELVGRGVTAGQRRRVAGQVGARPAKALGDEAEALAIRLVREAPAERAVEVGQQLGVVREPGRETSAQCVGRHGRRDRLREAGRDRLVAMEDVIRVDPEGPLRHLRGDGRVPIPIAADPRLPGEERSDVRSPGPGPPGVGRLRSVPSAPGGRGAASHAQPIERRVRLAVEAGDHGEDRLVKEGQGRPDLIQWRDGRRPQVGGPPQQRDLLTEPAPDVPILGRPDVTVGEPGEEPVDAAEGDEDRPATSFGRVGGEDRGDPEPVDGSPHVVVGRAAPAQPVDHRGEGVVRSFGGCPDDAGAPPRGAATPLPIRAPNRPDQLALLGEVDEPEVEAERADDDLGPAGVERLQLRDEPGAKPRIVAAAEPDRRPADALDEVEEVAAGLLGDDLAEQRAEEADLRRERIADAAGADRRRLGADGLVRRTASGAHRASPFRSRRAPVPQSFGPESAPRLVS
jgi:hypothetical protein